MKKFLSTFLVLLTLSQGAFVLASDTKGWKYNSEEISVSTSEIDLKSELKQDFRMFQTTISNVTDKNLIITIPDNAGMNEKITKILKPADTFKNLMIVPKEIAVNSYKEETGKTAVAKAHKGLIYVLASAGAVAAGVGMLGNYPSAKIDELIGHKKIKKEYKKYGTKVTDSITLAPGESTDVYILTPPDSETCEIISTSKEENSL